MMDRGHEQLADLQHNLHRTIQNQRGTAPPELSLQWRGLEDQRNVLIRYVPWGGVVAAALSILGVPFAIYYTKLARQASPLHERLAQIGIEDFALPPPPAPPTPWPTPKKVLAPEEGAGLLTVKEEGARSIVTLEASDLFKSGSADVNAS